MIETGDNRSALDAGLIARAQAGDISAFEDLVRRYRNEVYALCFYFTRNREDAWVLSQEVFIKAWRALSRFRGDSSFKTWLMRIAINTCRDYLRTPWLRRVDRRVDMDTLPEETQSDPLPDSQVLDAVMALPPKYKDVVLLRYYQDMKHKDIADTLGITVDVAKTRLKRANEKLRRKLEGWYYDE